MKTNKPLVHLQPGWNTAIGEPHGTEHLNQDRLRALEEARIAALPNTITRLEKRIVLLHKQIEKAEKLLDEARKEHEDVAQMREGC